MNEEFAHFTDEPVTKRGHIRLMALFYTTLALVSAGIFLLAVYKGFFIMMFIFGIPAFLTLYQARNYLRDLSATPVSVEGEVWRKWHKGNLFLLLFPSYYINVQGKVYTIKRQEYGSILEEDLVRIKCFPHSLTVEQLELYDTSDKKFVPAVSGEAG